ncbi:DUF4760 domain-containing protein [Catellatospora bangladeshensis]|uniref:DUF4760 domain-containing protein n=1 Tax=Catellatospora bangladeshensis TaxID=310355 RepID=UPI0019419B2B|nr:hypothetical protein [Catellatospora bangladeshensis]
MISDFVDVAAAFISMVAVVLTALFAVRQLRSAQTANHTIVAIELLTRVRSGDEFQEAEDYVINQLAKAYPEPDVSVGDLPPEVRRLVSRVALYYNGLGQMLAFAAVDPRLLMSTVSFRSRQAWRVLEPYILAERARRGETYLSHFEHLVHTAAHNPWDTAVRKLKLRRFASYPAALGLADRPKQAAQPREEDPRPAG